MKYIISMSMANQSMQILLNVEMELV